MKGFVQAKNRDQTRYFPRIIALCVQRAGPLECEKRLYPVEHMEHPPYIYTVQQNVLISRQTRYLGIVAHLLYPNARDVPRRRVDRFDIGLAGKLRAIDDFRVEVRTRFDNFMYPALDSMTIYIQY